MVSIAGNGWTANVLLNAAIQEDWTHIEALVDGDTKALALTGAEWVMNSFGKGRTCMVRVEPEADTHRDFDTKKETHRAYVRFSWENAPYPWHKSRYAVSKIPSIAAA